MFLFGLRGCFQLCVEEGVLSVPTAIKNFSIREVFNVPVVITDMSNSTETTVVEVITRRILVVEFKQGLVSVNIFHTPRKEKDDQEKEKKEEVERT